MLLRDIARSIGWRLPALVLLMSIVGITEGLTIALLLPLLTHVGISGAGQSGATAPIESLLEFLVGADPGPGLLLGLIVLVAILQALLFTGQSWWVAKLVRRYTAAWQMRLFEAFLSANWLFLTRRKSGELTNAITVECSRLTGAFITLAQLLSAAIVATIYLAFALLVSWQMTLLLIGLAGLMFLSIIRLYRISHAIGVATSPLNAELQVRVSESLSSAKIVKATVSEERTAAQVDRVVRDIERVNYLGMFLPTLVRGVFEFMGIVAVAAFLAYGIQWIGVAPASMLVVLALFVRLFPRFTTLQTLLHNLNTYVPAIVTMRQMLDDATAARERPAGQGVSFQVRLPATLQVENLSVGYTKGTPVLNSLTLSFGLPGMVGIVGGSGAGKSTLVHAMLGLVRPDAGTICLGDNDIAHASLASWRKSIGYVPQEDMFFHASVRENLALACPDASMEEVIRAARRAHAHEFIMALPEGYDTQIGDRGVALSGGQRQRLGIARALLSEPALLLMDEPTSALDSESEREVLATLEELRHSIGILIVAHRLATVKNADCIFVLEQGRVVEQGNWSELIARRDRFHSLAEIQHLVA
jgi:ATP-binding cassette subfamily C protein